MYNLLVSLAVATIVTVVFGYLFGGASGFSLGYGIVPGILAFFTTFVIIARRVIRKVEALAASAQPELQNRNIDRAVEVLKSAYPLSKWQFFLKSQLDGQIGTVLFAAKKFDAAVPYLQRSFKRNWVPRAMLATLHYKNKRYDEMVEVFEEAVKANKKQALLWNIYAYCLWKQNKRDAAIAVLQRAKEHVGSDEKTDRNLKSLQNDKKMKMRGWNMQWYQFHLDTPPQQQLRIQGRR